MLAINGIVRLFMWLCLTIGILTVAWTGYAVIGYHVQNPGASWDWPLIVIGANWLPSALGLWVWDKRKPESQSIGFFVFAVLAPLFTGAALLTSIQITSPPNLLLP